jgi:tetratricopeptide (TPR) repeat protein
MIPLKYCKLLWSVLFVLSVFISTAQAEPTWTEVRSPHFRVLTDGSVQQGRAVAAQFEQMRHVFVLEFNDPAIGSGAPLTIVAARDTSTFKALEPNEWKGTKGNVAGEFHRDWEKQFATVILDSPGNENQVVVFHEYTHSILHAQAHWLPVWLDEGFAEFYSYTRFEPGRTLIGAPSSRMPALKNQPLLPVSEMLDTADESKLIRDPMKANLFYAEAWGMVHFMMFGKGMDSGAKLNAFFRKLQDGAPEKDAFKDVFGDPRAFDRAFDIYLRGLTLQAGVLPADPKVDEKSFPDRKLPPAETEYELGCFQIGSRESTLGRARIEKALALDPKLAGAHEELGFLEFREGKDAEAVKEWQQAVDLDPARARSVFALAMSGTPISAMPLQQLQAMQGALQHVIDLSPEFAPAYVEMGLVDWRLGQMTKAYHDVQKAEHLEPWRAGYHILAGRILLNGHQPKIAAQYSHFVAERWTGPDHNEAVDLWNDVPASDRGDGAALALEMPAGAKVERGTLTELTCGSGPGVPMILTLTPEKPGAEPLTFKSEGRFQIGFSDSFWWGEDHFTLCHHLTGHPAIVAYKPEDKHLLDLEVRDDLPLPTKSSTSAEAAAR